MSDLPNDGPQGPGLSTDDARCPPDSRLYTPLTARRPAQLKTVSPIVSEDRAPLFLQFTVLPSGVPDTASLTIWRRGRPGAGESSTRIADGAAESRARRFASELRFRPAVVAGCPKKQAVQLDVVRLP